MNFLFDLPVILRWYAVITLLGITFLPISGKLLSKFMDKGYAFSRILGIVLVSISVWILAYLHIAPFSFSTIVFTCVVWFLLNSLTGGLSIQFKPKFHIDFSFSHLFNSYFPGRDNKRIRIIILIEEMLFLCALILYAYIRGHEPSIHGLEKYMDFGFINAILKSTYLPAQDMWLSPAISSQYTDGYFINYYYFGHFATALLTKLTAIPSAITYNLMLVHTFALSVVASFSIGASLFFFTSHAMNAFTEQYHIDTDPWIKKKTKSIKSYLFKTLRTLLHKKSENNVNTHDENKETKFMYPAVLAGLLTSFLVTLSGNLHTIYIFTSGYTAENPIPFWKIMTIPWNILTWQITYWYPNATRFIPNTIHEFPSYSWVVADLHGHVLDIPFVLLTIAVLFSYLITSTWSSNKNDYGKIVLLGVLTGVLYMTNAWDGLIYLGLSVLVVIVSYWFGRTRYELDTMDEQTISKINSSKKPSRIYLLFISFGLLIGAFFITTLPFNIYFKPFASGIGIVGGWEFAKFIRLIDGLNPVYHIGPLLLEKGNNLHSPLWMLFVLWGFFIILVFSFILFFINQYQNMSVFNKLTKRPRAWFLTRRANIGNIFILLLSIVSIGLIIFPEFFYAKDIYPAHYRANTMFKLGYQAFIMFSIVSAYTIAQIFYSKKLMIKKINVYIPWKIVIILLLILVCLYPYFSFDSYYTFSSRHTSPNRYKNLDGTTWFNLQYPDDMAAIIWLNNKHKENNSQELPIILEAIGDSYTDFGRISVHTGIPAILGWPVHEWLWRGSYDEPERRTKDVLNIYEGTDKETVRQLVSKYDVTYIIIGDLEREKYPNLNEALISEISYPVFTSGDTTVWELY